MKTKLSHVLLLGIMTIVSTVLVLAVYVMVFENRYIFFPVKYPGGQYAKAENIPGLTDCWMMTEDGVKLHGWFLPADSAIATLVMPHGNAGNISSAYAILLVLRQYGFNVFMFDYRGFGKSDGVPSEEGIYIDGRTAFDYAAKLPHVDSAKIVLWGTSLGGAVAVDVAAKRHAAGLILESTFTSAGDMAAEHYSFIFRYVLRTKLNSLEKIARIHTPLLVIHGDKDRTVPLRLGKELFAAANEPKEFYEITGADHNNTFMRGGTAYVERVREFVLKVVSKKQEGNDRVVPRQKRASS